MLEARTVERHAGSYKEDNNFINGMPEYTVEIKEHIAVNILIFFLQIIIRLISIFENNELINNEIIP